MKNHNTMKNKERIAILESEISRLKVANRTTNERLEAIEDKLGIERPKPPCSAITDALKEMGNLMVMVEQRKAKSEAPECVANNGVSDSPIKPDFIPDWKDAPEDAVAVAMDKDGDWYWYGSKPSVIVQYQSFAHKGVISDAGFATNAYLLPPDYWKSTLMMRPDAVSELNKALHNVLVNDAPNTRKSAPDYSHLLPEGYEFCSEEDAEKWVKVDDVGSEFKIGCVKDVFYGYVGTWLPIRPIQYKVTTHEITTAIPNPYMPDWSKAPEGAVAHAWDANGKSFWYTIVIDKELTSFMIDIERSNAPALPADLDWKQSLRVKPSK